MHSVYEVWQDVRRKISFPCFQDSQLSTCNATHESCGVSKPRRVVHNDTQQCKRSQGRFFFCQATREGPQERSASIFGVGRALPSTSFSL